MKKRIAALLMAVTVVISCMGVAFAADSGSVSLSGPSDHVKAGETFDVVVTLESNPGLAGLALNISYDSQYLTLTNSELVSGDEKIFSGSITSPSLDTKPYLLSFDSEGNVTGTGKLATLTFEVIEDAPGGEAEIVCTIKEAFDEGMNDVSMDGDKITVAVDGVHQHSLTKVEAKEATCTEAGNNEYYTCSCGKVFKDAEGTTETTVEAENIAAKGHTWDDGVVTKEPTEDTEGEKTFTCIVEGCGATKTEAIPALDHAHKLTPVEAKEATCTEKGNNAYYACSCGKVFKDAEGATETTVEAETIPAKGHTWDEGEVTKKPTCEEKGIKTYTCTVEGCGATKTEEIATVDHKYGEGDVCTVCGEEKHSGSSSRPSSDNTGTVVKPEVKVPFTDINGHWAADVIGKVYIDGIMNGVSDTEFGPDMTLTRGMVVTILYGLEGKPEVTAENKFTDVSEDQYYCNAVIWAYENGIVAGMGENVFAPNDNITRQQLATIMLQYAKFQGADVSKTTSLAAYKDADQVSAWAVEGMEWAVANGIISGKGDGILDAQGTATRAECAQIIYNFIGE